VGATVTGENGATGTVVYAEPTPHGALGSNWPKGIVPNVAAGATGKVHGKTAQWAVLVELVEKDTEYLSSFDSLYTIPCISIPQLVA